MDRADRKRQADAELARNTWGLVKSRKAPILFSIPLIIVFAIRTHVCSDAFYENDDPSPAFEYYGNYCGPGHGTDDDPVDDLDRECQKHDKAYE